jgi:ABC-type nitrate/sulfonate/bicarbonate transport system substrate-binding protein
MNVERDFAVLQLGGQPEMMAGLTSGRVDAAMLNAEFTILARRAGFRPLVNMAVEGPAFPTGTLNTSRGFIRNNEDTIRRLVRAYVEGIHYAKTRREFSIGVLKKYMKNDDTAYLGEIYELYLQHFIPKVPTPSPEAVRTVLRQLGEKDPKARNATPQQFMDTRFMEELEKDGFIQRLWR